MARVYLLQWRDLGQQPSAALARSRQTSDSTIKQCQHWAGSNFRKPAPVTAMAKMSGLPERSFARKALDYVHALRLEEAKHMLETGDAPVAAIANEVGYEDTSFFSRLSAARSAAHADAIPHTLRSLRRALLTR